MDAFGYRLLAGRDGAQGYACGGDGQTVTARGLHAGKTYTLYCVTPGGAREHARRTADASGMARFTLSGAQPVFLALDGRPVLWEDDRAEERYCQACDLLRAQARMLEAAQRQAREKAAAYQEAAERPEAPKETAQAETAAAPYELTEAELEADNKTPEEAEAPAGTQEELREPAQPKLRQGTGEGVDALPRLIWPKEAAELKPYFDTQPPIRPFDAPGWRFVRVPSPIRSVGYCAVGMYASDCRVRQVAYAVPGTPHHAPAFLPGYRYQPGMDGKGYWTLWRRL